MSPPAACPGALRRQKEGVRAQRSQRRWGRGAPGHHITCCHSSMCQLGGQSNWLHAWRACGFSSPHSAAGAGDSPGCRQSTSRVWIPTPQGAEQGPQEPVCHLHQNTTGQVEASRETTCSGQRVHDFQFSGHPCADPRAMAASPLDARKTQKPNAERPEMSGKCSKVYASGKAQSTREAEFCPF